MVLKARVISTILGVLFLICSTPGGMARSSIPELARASFFESSEVSADDGREDVSLTAFISENDEAALFEGEETSPESFEGEQEQEKRKQKRQNRPASAKAFMKTLGNETMSFNSVEKGYPRKGSVVVARRQVAEAIRYLQIEALIS